MLVSSHILPEVEQTCDRVVVMARGQVRADARPGELIQASREQAAYVIECRVAGDPAAIVAAFQSVNGVDHCEREVMADGWMKIRVWPAAGVLDIREELATAAAAGGTRVRELRRESPGLERVFMGLVESEDAGASA